VLKQCSPNITARLRLIEAAHRGWKIKPVLCGHKCPRFHFKKVGGRFAPTHKLFGFRSSFPLSATE
jgi:hypothetical protein